MAVSLARRYTLSPQGSGNSMDAARSANVVCFGSFKLDLKAGELHQDGRKILLQEQPFQVLKMLLEHPGSVRSSGPMTRSSSSTTASMLLSRNCGWRWWIRLRSRAMWKRWRGAAIP